MSDTPSTLDAGSASTFGLDLLRSADGSQRLSSGAAAARRPMPIPFGPFIAFAALEWLFFGERLSEWFAGWVA